MARRRSRAGVAGRFAPAAERLAGAAAQHSIAVAGALSFVWPGLGQWYAGRQRRAIELAIPVLVVGLVGITMLAGGVERLVISLLDGATALSLVLAIAAVGAWRLLALAEPIVVAGGPKVVRRADLAIVGGLAVGVVAMHLALGSISWSFYRAGQAIFDPGPIAGGPSPAPSDGASEAPGTPFATPPTGESRINVLLTGIDSGAQRTQALTDTMIIASLDPASGGTSMVSFPRDIARFELYNGGTYAGKLNSLMSYAGRHPEAFPEGGLPALMRQLGSMLGIPIHYYAAVNLDGFVELVDAMGGVTITYPRDIDDFTYAGWNDGRVGFHLAAGTHDLDGQMALAFVRSRKAAGENDFTRAARQQLLLQAVRRQLTDPAMVPRLPAILDAAAKTLRTNFPSGRVAEMLDISRSVNDAATEKVVLGPPYSFHPPTNTTGGIYILLLDIAKVEALSIELYGTDSAYWSATAVPSGAPVDDIGSGSKRSP